MRTTIELPDKLLIAAKKRAAELRRPLRSLIEEGLRNLLERGPAPAGERIQWVTVDGGLPSGLDIGNRVAMYDWFQSKK